MHNLEDVKDLLYNYNKFKCILEDKLQLVEEVEMYGLPEKSSSVSIYPVNSVSDSKDGIEEEYINTLNRQIKSLERHINAINNALNTIKGDKYYKIIEYRYFKTMSYSQIGKIFYLDKSSVCRNDKRLLTELKKCLFPDDATITQR